MANFTPSKKTAQDFNGGVEYIDGFGEIEGDAVHAETVNNLVESSLYAQEQAESAVSTAESALSQIEQVVSRAAETKNLYNLGAFDTFVSNGDGSVTITRQTGYIVLDGSDDELWVKPSEQNPGFRFTCNASTTLFNLYGSISASMPYGYLLNNSGYVASSFNNANSGNVTKGFSFSTGKYLSIYDNRFTSLSDFKNYLSLNHLIIQYRTASHIAEKVIINQQIHGIHDWLNKIFPVGGGERYIQFPNAKTPAELFSDTVWEIDTSLQGKTIIGSGGSYTFGATGGAEKHTLTVAQLPSHFHYPNEQGYSNIDTRQTGANTWCLMAAKDTKNVWGHDVQSSNTGDGQAFNIMQPYTVVNYWRRTA